MKAVILVFPKIMPDFPESHQWTLLPLSLLAIASPLIQTNYEVKLIDQRANTFWKEELEEAVKILDPICVGLSVMTGFPIRGALECSQLAKQISPNTPVVWGGVHPSLLPEQTLQSPWVDVVVRGEGEQTFFHLVEALRSGQSLANIPGVFFKKDGQIIGNTAAEFLDLDDLPRPAYQLVDIEKYLSAPFMTTKKPIAFYTSRGCPWRCKYCYNLAFNQRRWRALSAEKVLAEIDYLIDKYNVDSFFLLDDNFFVDRDRVYEICHAILNRRLKLTFYNANCRVDTIENYSLETLELLRETGFDRLFIGVESGSNQVLKNIDKDISVEQIKGANKKLKQIGIVPVYSFMVGLPLEKKKDIEATLSLMVQLLDDYPAALVNPLNIYSPFPGTPLYNECLKLGMPEPHSLNDWVEFDYVKVNYRANFAQDELEFMEEAYLISNLIDSKLFRPSNVFAGCLKKIYSASIRSRIRHRFYYLMPEAMWLGKRRKFWADPLVSKL